MPDTQSSVERVEQLRSVYFNRGQLDPIQIAGIEGIYRSSLSFPSNKKTIDVLLFEADRYATAHLESHVFEVLKTLTWCGEGQINFHRRSEFRSGERNNHDLYLFGPTLLWGGQIVDTETIEQKIKLGIPKGKEGSKVVFFYQLERLLEQSPSWERCFPINILIVSAEQYPEYRRDIAAYLNQLKVRDIIDLVERPEFVGLADRSAFNIVGTPSKEDLLKDPSKYPADIAFINLMCTQKPLLDELQLPLIQSYRAANPYTFVRATANEHQAHIMTRGEPHPRMGGGVDFGPNSKEYRKLEDYCGDVWSLVRELAKSSRYGLSYFHFLRPDTSLLANWGDPLALPKSRGGVNPITPTDIESFYHTYANSLQHHFLSGDELLRLLQHKGYIIGSFDIPYIDKVESIDDPVEAFLSGRAFLPSVEAAHKIGKWSSSKIQATVRDIGASFRRFNQLAEQGRYEEKPIIVFDDELCATGILHVLDPDRKYPVDHPSILVKTTSHYHAWQLYHDWLRINSEGLAPNFQTPKIRIPIPITDSESFVVEEAIIGPTVGDLLERVSQQTSGDRRYSKLIKAIYDVETERWLYYVHTFKELTPFPGGEPKPVNIDAVIQSYIDNLYIAFEHRQEYTDIKFTENELAHIKKILIEYGWDEFIREDTVRRNLGATFRNSIAKTGKINISLDDFLKPVKKGNTLIRKDLRDLLYRVDQGDKYSFILEDPIEMLYFSTGGLTEEERTQRIREVMDNFTGLPLERGLLPMITYRNSRESDLFLATYGLKIHNKMQSNLLDSEEGMRTLKKYKEVMKYHDKHAIEACRNLPENDSLRKDLLPYLERMGSFGTISYDGTYKV